MNSRRGRRATRLLAAHPKEGPRTTADLRRLAGPQPARADEVEQARRIALPAHARAVATASARATAALDQLRDAAALPRPAGGATLRADHRLARLTAAMSVARPAGGSRATAVPPDGLDSIDFGMVTAPRLPRVASILVGQTAGSVVARCLSVDGHGGQFVCACDREERQAAAGGRDGGGRGLT